MTELITQDKDIKDLVYVIRGQQVMLDSDLAELYGYEVGQFNRQVKRNINRFPDDFMIRLTKEEYSEILKCQIGISSGYGGRRYDPYAFTEQGIYMLTSVLNNEIAIQQSVFIIRAFKKMRHYLAENSQLLNKQDMLQISNCLVRHEEDITKIKQTMASKSDIDKIMDNFIDENNVKEITILNGQKFEAIEAYTKIYKQALHSIYVIDDYINIVTLSQLKHKNKNVKVILFSENKGSGSNKLRKCEIDTFNAEYPTLTLKKNGLAHDRYIIIDYKTSNEKIYHCGASSKDAGKKVCGINELDDRAILYGVVDKLLGFH